ncbi:Peroxisomal multifunctional enzyme type 2 [Armadillidium nasatum]|uniref:Peroxisomal multifunctional enzyme type 2 n=1 Tax=Armadillidium nasatum TaxID=96803 RepID=A0A5N5T6Y3_9CRUS|nr:Peroxisomal multifunctional enzyme type 2 [Armadillidium nasatum]
MSNASDVRFDDQVAIVTGAGGGLGRAYALLFASRGAKVVVNDLGGNPSGEGKDSRAADIVVNEIRNAGGIAVADYNSVEDGEKIVETALQNFGRIDILVNNAGILRDKSFARISDADWAKLGLLGLSNTVSIEGAKYDIHCNTIAPMGGTRLTEGIIPPDRWERTKGVMCRKSLAELVTPEAVRDNWEKISDFNEAMHIESNTEAAALLGITLEDLKSEPGNKTVNPNSSAPTHSSGPLAAVGHSMKNYPYTFESKDVILYALGVGVSTKDEDGLKFLYEGDEDFSPLPTFAIIPAQEALMSSGFFLKLPGWNVNLAKVLHGEQYIEIHKPIPTSGTLISDVKITDVLDKGSGAVMIAEVRTVNEKGDLIATSQWSVFVVGDGGFNGPRNSSNVVPLASPPDRKPDVVSTFKTSVDQPALYRLCGDRNPLHIDPSFAALGGFEEPILHGLCSFGISARAILKEFCNNDVSKFKAIKTRFAKPVIPGQTLVTSMWKVGNRIFFETAVKENNKVCLSGGYVDILGGSSKL